MTEEKKIYTEADKEYLANTDIDNAAMFREIRKLNTKVDELNGKIEPVPEEERIRKRKAEILAIPDKHTRLKAIEDNLDLFM